MTDVTKTQIKEWKKAHGAIHEITVPLDDEGTVAVGYLKKPDLKTLSAAAKFAETDPLKSGSIILENCWLGGDESIRTEDEARMSAIQVAQGLFKVRIAKVKKI